MSDCTCGPYWSVIPPGPCPLHDAENYYWRQRTLREFGRPLIVQGDHTIPIRPTNTIWVTV